jgi:hypothetical protein
VLKGVIGVISIPKMIGTLVGTNAHILITHGTGFPVSGWIVEFTIVEYFLNFLISASVNRTFFPRLEASFSSFLYSSRVYII